MCVRTPAEDAPRRLEALRDVGWRNAEMPPDKTKIVALSHAEMPHVEAPTRGGGVGVLRRRARTPANGGPFPRRHYGVRRFRSASRGSAFA